MGTLEVEKIVSDRTDVVIESRERRRRTEKVQMRLRTDEKRVDAPMQDVVRQHVCGWCTSR